MRQRRASFESERRFSFESDDWRSVTETGGYARLSGDWTAPPPPDGAPAAAEWPLEAAGPDTMHALSTLQEETVAAAAAGPGDALGRSSFRISSRQSQRLPAPRSLSVQSSAPQNIGDASEVALSEGGSLPAATSLYAGEQATSSGNTSPPSRPDSGLRRAPRKGQGAVEGHRMSPAVLAAIAEWCLQRRVSGAGHAAGGHDSLASYKAGTRSRRGPAQPAAPSLAGASARLGGGAKLRARQRALPPMLPGEGAATGAAGSHRHMRGSVSLASSLSGGLQSRGSAQTPIRAAESQRTASSADARTSVSLDDNPGGGGGSGGVSSSGEEHSSLSVTVTAQQSGDASGELLTADGGGFELLRRVPGIRTGRRVSFDASLGRASTDDDATGGSGGAASESLTASESPTASSEQVDASADGAADRVESPRLDAAVAVSEDGPAERHGSPSGPATAAPARPELPGPQPPAHTPVVRDCARATA